MLESDLIDVFIERTDLVARLSRLAMLGEMWERDDSAVFDQPLEARQYGEDGSSRCHICGQPVSRHSSAQLFGGCGGV